LTNVAPRNDLRDTLLVVGRNRIFIAVLTLLAALGAAIYVETTPDRYHASTQLLINTAASPFNPGQITVNASAVPTAVAILRSTRIVTETKAKLGSGSGSWKVEDVSAVPDSDIVNVTVTAPTARGSETAVNAFAQAYLDYRDNIIQTGAKSRAAAFDQQVATLTRQLDSLSSQLDRVPPKSAKGTILESEYQSTLTAEQTFAQNAKQYRILAKLHDAGVTITAPATAPGTLVPHHLARKAVLAGVLGLLAGLLLSFTANSLGFGSVFDALRRRRRKASSGRPAEAGLLAR
jgi:uncharacterized protein involved in exopolysaccharide biosynthesis